MSLIKLTRVNFHISQRQFERLKLLSNREGRPMAELLRLAIDMLLDQRLKSTPPQAEAAHGESVED